MCGIVAACGGVDVDECDIVDLAGGRQPLSGDGWHLVANGELRHPRPRREELACRRLFDGASGVSARR